MMMMIIMVLMMATMAMMMNMICLNRKTLPHDIFYFVVTLSQKFLIEQGAMFRSKRSFIFPQMRVLSVFLFCFTPEAEANRNKNYH